MAENHTVDIDEAVDALIVWFKSQDIEPKDAIPICLRLIAEQFARNDQDPDKLLECIRVSARVLGLEIQRALSMWKAGPRK